MTAGFTGGILSTSTGTSGPPIVIALSAKQLEPAVFRATISAIFLVQGSAALVASYRRMLNERLDRFGELLERQKGRPQ